MEEQLGFVADINSKPMEDGLNRIEERVESTAKAVEKSGMSVDDFAKHMQGVLSSFEKLAGSVDKSTEAQNRSVEAYRELVNVITSSAEKAASAQQNTTNSAQKLGDTLQKTGEKGKAGLGEIVQGAESIPGPIGSAISSVNGLTKASLRFIATPVGAVLAAISAALAMVTSWFKRTEEGQDALRVGSAYFTQTLESLLDVADNVGEFLYNAFTKPKEALNSLWTNLKNKLMADMKRFAEMGQGIIDIFSGNVSEGMKKVGTAWAGIGAGGATMKFVSDLNDKANKRVEISKRQNALDKEERKQLVEKAKLEAKIENLRAKAYDQTVSESERKKAINEATKLTNKLYDEEVRLAKERHAIIKETNQLSHSNKSDKEKEAQAEAALYEIESRRASAQRGLLRQSNRFNDSGSSKTTKAGRSDASREHAAAIQEERRYQEELAKIQQEAADARRDAEIAAIENDGERERAEQDEQHKRNIRQIEQQADEMKKAVYEHNKKVWENAHKDSPYELTEQGKNGWQGIQLSDEQGNIIKARMEKENAEYSRMVEKRIKDEEAANKEAINTYLKEYGTYQQKREAIYAEANDQICALEEQLGKATTEEEKAAIEARINTVKAGTKKELDGLDQEIMDKSELWSKFFSDFSNRSSASIRNIMADISDLIDYMNGVEGAKIPDIFADSESTVKAINDAMADPSARKKFTDGLQNQWKIFKKMVDESNPFKLIAQGFKDNDPESLAKGFQGVAQAIGEVKNIMSDLGVEADSTVGKVTSTIGDAASYAAQGAQIGGVWGAAAGAALGIAKGLVGALGADYSDYQTLVEEYGKLIDVWDELIDKKSEYINMSWGEESIRAGEEAVALVNKQTEAYKELGRARLNAGASAGSHSIGVRTRTSMSDADWMAVAASLGRTSADWAGLGGRLEGLFDLSAEQLEKLKEDAPAFWAKLDEETRNYLQGIIDGATKIESMQQQVKEQITGTSFDGVFDSFLSQLNDLADGSEEVFGNVTDNFQKMMNSFVVNNMIGNKLKADLTDWYNRWYEAYNGDKAIDADEVARLREEYDALFKGAAGQVEALREQGLIAAVGTEQAQEAKEYFTSLRDSWLSTLTDMTADGKEWKQNILRTMFEDLVDATVLDVPVTVNEQTFDTFGKYLVDWTKRYKEAVESGNIEVMKALLDEQTTLREEQAKKSKEIADNLGYEIVNEFSNSIDNLSDMFLNNLLDLNADAEDMGKEIGSTLIQEMLKQMLASEQYANRMKEIKEHWQNALNGDEAYTYESVMAEITALNNDIANDEAIGALAAQWKELNKQVEQSKSPFSDLRSTFRGTLMSLESDAQSFADNLNNTILQDLLDKQVFSKPLTVAEKEFEDFDAYVADWNKRYIEAVENNETEAIEALITELTGVQGQLDEATKELRESLIRKQEDTTFKDMADSFVSSLMDVNSTAKDWAEDIGRTMAQKIIEQMVVAKQIQPLLDNLQKAFDTAMGTGGTWQTAVADTGVQLAMQQIKDAYPELQKLATGIMNGLGVRMEEAKEGFSDLRGTLVSTLTDMEGDAQKLGKNIGQTMIQQMLDALVEKKYAERMKTINEQWADALESGDTTKIDSVRNSVVSLYQAISNDSSVKQLADDLRELTKEAEETPLHGFRSNFLSQLTDMESDTKDFAAEINQILTEAFIDKFVLGDAFDERLAEWEKEYSKLMGDPEMSAEARAKALKQLGENIAAESETMKEQARAIQDMFNTGGEEYGDQQATVNMADKATYDQFEMYLGIATAQQITGEQQLGVTQQILYTLQAMSGITSPMGGMSEEMRNMWLISNQYLLDIKQSNREILNSFGLKLDSINVKLSKL